MHKMLKLNKILPYALTCHGRLSWHSNDVQGEKSQILAMSWLNICNSNVMMGKIPRWATLQANSNTPHKIIHNYLKQPGLRLFDMVSLLTKCDFLKGNELNFGKVMTQ
jgi:hypothetical protein